MPASHSGSEQKRTDLSLCVVGSESVTEQPEEGPGRHSRNPNVSGAAAATARWAESSLGAARRGRSKRVGRGRREHGGQQGQHELGDGDDDDEKLSSRAGQGRTFWVRGWGRGGVCWVIHLGEKRVGGCKETPRGRAPLNPRAHCSRTFHGTAAFTPLAGFHIILAFVSGWPCSAF